jgi:hypothetical protein
MAKAARDFFQSLLEWTSGAIVTAEANHDHPPATATAKRSRKKPRDVPGAPKVKTERPRPGRDPNAPKKPLTPFMHYCNFRRAQMKDSNTGKQSTATS